jgi:hypothetical protein
MNTDEAVRGILNVGKKIGARRSRKSAQMSVFFRP